MDALFQDIRYAWRGLRKAPGFALAAVLTIGLAIGANTVAVTWLERFVLRPLPAVPASGALVGVTTAGPGDDLWQVSYPNWRDWREGQRSFTDLAAQTFAELALRTDGPAERAWGSFVTANFFDVLGIRPALGRAFRPDEETAQALVAVVSDEYWRRRFGADPGVVGRHVLLNGHDLTLVGVAPAGFGGTISVLRFDLWLPLSSYELLTGSPGTLAARGENMLDGIARLRPGVSIAQARQDLNAVHRRLMPLQPSLNRNTTVSVRWYSDVGTATVFRPVTATLLGITVVVLLVACANLANLLLARAAARRREVGIRLAIGVGRARLVRQLLTESLVLSLAGGVLGVLVAFWGKDAMLALLPAAPYPIFVDFSLDGRVLAVALGVSVLTGLVFGLAPALQTSRLDLVTALRGGAGGAARRSRLQSALVTCQVALSLVCLVCAGLFVRSLLRSRAIDAGMQGPQHVLLARTDLFRAGYSDSTGPAALERLLERLRAVPGVRSASVSSMMPLDLGGWNSTEVTVEGYTYGPDEIKAIPFSNVGPDWFETIGTPIVRGRGIGAGDREGTLPVVVVNESFAHRFWPGQDPIGRRVTVSGRERTVVGVARNAGAQDLQVLRGRVSPVFYRPILQSWRPSFTVQLRTAGEAASLQPALRRVFQEVDPALPLTDVRPLDRHIAQAFLFQRISAWVLGTFGLLALVLSAVGLYGVLAYSVAQRTREMGVRIAVGASRRHVLGLVIGRAMRLTAIGLAAGLLLAVGAGRVLQSQILDVSPLDPIAFGAVVALLGAVALLAAWLPARRAARVDPVIALQAE